MSLVFGANTTDRVDCGSASTLDNLAAGAFSVWAWVYRTSDGANQHVITKDPVGFAGWNLAITNNEAEGQVNFYVARSTTNTSYRSNTSNVLALNTWYFVAATYDDTLTPECRLYIGTLTTPVAEVSGYSASTDGTGTNTSDASANVYIGNLQRANTNPFKGRIASCGIVSGVLTVGQLTDIQWRGRVRTTTLAQWVLGVTGTGTQPDVTGNGNSGSVTGATRGDRPPLPRMVA